MDGQAQWPWWWQTPFTREEVITAAVLHELERIRRLARGAPGAYDDLVVDGEIDYGRPFPEELV